MQKSLSQCLLTCRGIKRSLTATKCGFLIQHAISSRHSFTSAPTTVELQQKQQQQQEHQPAVSTYRRIRIPTQTTSHRIPLSIVDIHVRKEQLPFCYFFRENLDENELEESLRLVLKDFPQTGGVICGKSHTAIQCDPNDTVHVSFGKINLTLNEWQQQERGHLHSSYSADHKCGRGGHPVLLPIFDSLFENIDLSSSKSDHSMTTTCPALVKIRITYFEGKGTAIAVNFCHALGDTSTCIHFVQSWGKRMRQKDYQKAGVDRSEACVSGMMTADIADIMGLVVAPVHTMFPAFPLIAATYLPEIVREWFVENTRVLSDTAVPPGSTAKESTLMHPPNSIPHEYVRLVFAASLLDRLKEMGSYSCEYDGISASFVSTNDMLTSYGWLLKRHLSQNADHNLSMVINLRGRSGVDPTLFGNGISHVVATNLQDMKGPNQLDLSPEQLFTDNLCLGAKRIRQALQAGILNLPEALLASRMGRALPAPSNSTQSFSTTSWGQFPLYKIRFAEHTLAGFHGHPAYPLPEGRTFASVITPCPDGACRYEMLLPSDQAQQARVRHVEMISICMDWTKPVS